MKLIIEQDEFTEYWDHTQECEKEGICGCGTPYVIGPCLLCNGFYVETNRASFSVRLIDADGDAARINDFCCPNCARASFDDLLMIARSEQGPAAHEARVLAEQRELLVDLPEFKTAYNYILTSWFSADARARSLTLVLECDTLERRFTTKATGFVYLLASPDGYCKIGRAKRLDSRLKQIGLQLPYKVELIHSIPVANPIQAERLMHQRFASQRMNGEWFNLSTEDIEWFKGQSALRETQGV